MRRSRAVHRLLQAAYLIVAWCLLTACERSEPPTFTYVALGDSFVAGGGIGQTSTTCLRSDQNYPAIVARELRVDHFVDVSCGGASTNSILTGVSETGARRTPQADAVGPETDLVTVGIGGNDGKLFAVLFHSCFLPPTSSPQTCHTSIRGLEPALRQTRTNVASALRELRGLAPRAQIVLVGYPRIAPEAGECAALPTTPDALVALAGIEEALEETLHAAARDAGADISFVSMREVSSGHDACAGEAAWVNGITATPGDGAPLHPRALGMRGVASTLLSHVERP